MEERGSALIFTDDERKHDEIKTIDVGMEHLTDFRGALVNTLTVSRIDDWLKYYAENPETAVLRDYVNWQKNEITRNLTTVQKLKALNFLDPYDHYGRDSWAQMVCSAAGEVDAQPAVDELNSHAAEYALYRALSDDDFRMHIADYIQMDDIPRVLFDSLVRETERMTDDPNLSLSDAMDNAVQEYRRFAAGNPGDPAILEKADIEDIAEDLSNIFQSDLLKRAPGGTTVSEWTDQIRNDAAYYSYDDTNVNDILERNPKAVIDVVTQWVSEEDMDEELSGCSADNILEALNVVVPGEEHMLYYIQKDSINTMLGKHVENFDDANIETCRTAYDENQPFDETLPLKEILMQCDKRSKETLPLLNISVEKSPEGGISLGISAGQIDYIPENSFQLLSHRRGEQLHEIRIDDSIKEIRDMAFEGDFSSGGVDTIRLPEKITLCGNPFFFVFPYEKVQVGNRALDTRTIMKELEGTGTIRAFYMSLRLADMMDRNRVPITQKNAEAMNLVLHYDDRELHAYRSIRKDPRLGEMDLSEDLCHDYRNTGLNVRSFLDLQRKTQDAQFGRIKEQLSEDFKRRYHGNVPRVIDRITGYVMDGIISRDFASSGKLNVKEMRAAMLSGYSAEWVLPVMDAYAGKPELHSILASPNLSYISESIVSDQKNNGKVSGKTKDYIDFMVHHPATRHELLTEISRAREVLSLKSDTTIENIHVQLEGQRAVGEIAAIKRDYPGFSLDSLQCILKNNEVHLNGNKAYIMDAHDPRQVMLGYDTNCCQHLNGAGETAMMYGLLRPEAGFFVIENERTRKILAQAESWERDKDTLVFDNIEFADDRQVSQFAPVIAQWAAESGYENIYMGTGYNEMAYGNGIRRISGIDPPFDKASDEAFDMDDLYTDADRAAAVIKENGMVEPYFSEAYEKSTGHSLEKGPKIVKIAELKDMKAKKEGRQNARDRRAQLPER